MQRSDAFNPAVESLARTISRESSDLMSPTVFREGQFRFFFFSREESRMHIHAQSPDGEAKIWMEPEIEIAVNHGLPEKEVNTVLRLAREHEDEIRRAWRAHFGR
jgi:hypothetical protein